MTLALKGRCCHRPQGGTWVLGPTVSLSLVSFWLAHELRAALSQC